MRIESWISRSLVLGFVLIVISKQVKAQAVTEDDKNGLVINVDGGAEVSFEKGQKITDAPSFEDSVSVKITVDYQGVDKKLNSDFKVETIKPPKLLIMDPLERIYKGSFELGVNDFKSVPYASFKFNTIRNKQYNAGIDLKHFSSNLGINSLADARFSENDIALYGKKMGRRFDSYINLDYNFDTYRAYGYDPTLFVIDKSLDQQYFSFLELKGGSFNKKDKDVKNYWRIDPFYQQLYGNHGVEEHRIGFNGSFAIYNWQPKEGALLSMDSLYKKNKLKGVLSLEGGMDQLWSKDTSKSSENVFVDFHVAYKVKNDVFSLMIAPGVQLTSNAGGALWFNPKATLDYSFVKDILIAYGEWKYGQIDRNYYMTYYQQNPFIAATLPYQNTITRNNVRAGLKGALSSKTTFNLGFHYRNIKNFALYINDQNSVASRRFNVLFDDVIHRQAFGELVFENKKIKSGLIAEYNVYEVYHYDAFHLPAIFGQLYFKYNIQNKFRIGTDLFYFGQQKAVDITDPSLQTSITLPAIFDFNLMLEYNYSKKLGAFFRVNNLLSNNHQRWNQYMNQGINVLGGVKYAF